MTEDGEYESFIRAKKKNQILNEVMVSGSTFPVDLSLKLGQDLESVEETLRELVSQGLVENNQGYYHLTYKGLELSRKAKEST